MARRRDIVGAAPAPRRGDIDRRMLVAGAAAALAVPRRAGAQQPGRTYRVASAYIAAAPNVAELDAALLEGLRENGFERGRNLIYDVRHGVGALSGMPAVVDELLAARPDLLLGIDQVAQVMRAKTTSIPIILTFSSDPVAAGLVQSLARPGRNVTGLSALSEAMTAKEISLLGEILPGPKTVAILIDATVPAAPNIERHAREAAEATQARLVVHAVKDRPALEQALARIERDRPDAVAITVSGLLNASRELIIDTMTRLRLPAVGLGAGQDRPGVLFYYRPNGPWLWRRAGWYAAQILKGARPADLLVEQPSVFELVLNLKTARALGISIPPTILLRASRFIQ